MLVLTNYLKKQIYNMVQEVKSGLYHIYGSVFFVEFLDECTCFISAPDDNENLQNLMVFGGSFVWGNRKLYRDSMVHNE